MVNWELYEDDNPCLWDDTLLLAKDYNIFQSYLWGEYKRCTNWVPIRYWAKGKNGDVIAMAQLLVKSLPFGIKILWVAGGPIFGFTKYGEDKLENIISGLILTIRDVYPRSLIRFNILTAHNPDSAYLVNKSCRRPLYKINSGYSIVMNLDLSLEKLREQMTSKHRYYAKKSACNLLTWSVGNSDKHLCELVSLHNEMTTDKKLLNITIKYEELKCLRDRLNEKVLVLTGYAGGRPVTSCLVLLFEGKSYYHVAATSRQGRAFNASYAMFEKLTQELKSKGAIQFDFGGIDPESLTAAGVDHFKRGFNKKIFEYLGEWESASSGFLRLGVNLAIKSKGI